MQCDRQLTCTRKVRVAALIPGSTVLPRRCCASHRWQLGRVLSCSQQAAPYTTGVLTQTHAPSTHSSQPLQMLMAMALLPKPQGRPQSSCRSRRNRSRMQKQSP